TSIDLSFVAAMVGIMVVSSLAALMGSGDTKILVPMSVVFPVRTMTALIVGLVLSALSVVVKKNLFMLKDQDLIEGGKNAALKYVSLPFVPFAALGFLLAWVTVLPL
ncbi:hypothetical protein MUP77_15300, partial [Candidatus Bathyarchaeota archaeon]|nr:hypothetical protein [Candidatus Bathyarchaeota archaeon]